MGDPNKDFTSMESLLEHRIKCLKFELKLLEQELNKKKELAAKAAAKQEKCYDQKTK